MVVDFNQNMFGSTVSVPKTARVIFVADMFQRDYVGGAELTTQALIDASPYEVFQLHARDVTQDLIQQNHDRFWIFGNATQLNLQLLPVIVANLKYSVVEYDYKYCRFRSPEKHVYETMLPCDCHNQMHGKMVSTFFYGAMGTWWMSEKQLERYATLFPFLLEKKHVVLSSVLGDKTLDLIAALRAKHANIQRSGWIVLGSGSWVKGAKAAEEWCKANDKAYEVVWNVPYERLLEKLAQAEGFAYLPMGGDTCPRMVIEAKLLGCELKLNDNVQHKDEEWFSSPTSGMFETHLRSAPDTFWNGIRDMIEHKPTISGYVTTYNCVTQRYPFERCIQSMLQFCNEVCIVDGGSTDTTVDRLAFFAYPAITTGQLEDLRVMISLDREPFEFPNELGHSEPVKRDPRIRVKVVKRDWTHPRSAVFDGMQKAEARAMCTGEFCWQMDSDEIVHEDDVIKVTTLARGLPNTAMVLALPVVEYWGGPDKVRIDVTPWKWRLSRNVPQITHGIPQELRRIDADGNLYAAQGTDGCDVIDSTTYQRVPFMNFYTQEAHADRQGALTGDVAALQRYQSWFTLVTNQVPGVYHYSWFDIGRKIRLYRDFWTRHWCVLEGKTYVDTADTNMMFDVPWSEVTDAMIDVRAKELQATGGHVFHAKWDGHITPWINVEKRQPKLMLDKENASP